jgi:hypothetical protein
MVLVLGFVENEEAFSTLAFMKDKFVKGKTILL